MFDKWILKTFDHIVGKFFEFIGRQVERWDDFAGDGIAYKGTDGSVIDRFSYRSESCEVCNRNKSGMSSIQNSYLLGSVGRQVRHKFYIKSCFCSREVLLNGSWSFNYPKMK